MLCAWIFSIVWQASHPEKRVSTVGKGEPALVEGGDVPGVKGSDIEKDHGEAGVVGTS